MNISSIAGVMGVGSSIPYACSKGALNTLTLTLARWFSPAVRVNTVCPGFIQTRWLLGGMGEENYNKLKTSQEQTAPLRQAGTPEQMAEAGVVLPHQRLQHHRRVPDRRRRHPPRQPADEGAVASSCRTAGLQARSCHGLPDCAHLARS